LLLSLGATLGTVLAKVLLVYVKQGFGDFLPGIYVSPEHYLTVFALVNVAAVFCSFFPSLTIKGIVISKTLGGKS
jgi:hypothetical protein